MLKSFPASSQITVLEKALASSALRHKVISNNIANVNTPGFKRSEVSFSETLSEVLATDKIRLAVTNARHIAPPNINTPSGVVNVVATDSLRTDGNNVDIDREMAELAKNSLYYEAVAQQLSRYFSNLKSAIKEGRS